MNIETQFSKSIALLNFHKSIVGCSLFYILKQFGQKEPPPNFYEVKASMLLVIPKISWSANKFHSRPLLPIYMYVQALLKVVSSATIHGFYSLLSLYPMIWWPKLFNAFGWRPTNHDHKSIFNASPWPSKRLGGGLMGGHSNKVRC